MVPLVFILNGVTKGTWFDAFLFAVAVAVGLTPEMLPMIVTVNLARGALAMAKKRVIVKRLNSIQNFGAMDVLCTDKTGTLTQDRVVLEKYSDAMGQENPRVLRYAYVNSYYQTGLKNLLDIAVLRHGHLYGELQIEKLYRKVDEIPFDFTRKRMSVIVEKRNASHVLICKGALEEIFSLCTHADIGGKVLPIGEISKEQCYQVAQSLNDDGMRVIAVAYKDVPPGRQDYTTQDESAMTLLGYVAFLDPPKETAAEAIGALGRLGVKVKVLTGDNDRVTRKICRDVGLSVKDLLLGSQVELMADDELAEATETTTVFAKLTPAQKQRIVMAMHRKGHVVGFLGDGINDAAALKAADVGISVDNAVDIAKESADLILLEKSLLILEQGVTEGRKVFGNIVKYIKMGASSNFGNVFSVLGASSLLPFLPMRPVQLLTQNLLYDLSQTAIPFDNVDEEYLLKPRRWEIGDIGRFMLFIGPISSIFDYATFALMWWGFRANVPQAQGLFQSGWFVEGLLSQTLVVHMIRTRKIPFLQSRASAPLILMTAVIMAVGVYLPFSGLGARIGLVPLPWDFFPWLLAFLGVYCVLTQWVKTWFISRYGYN
jgi:Mg2+-importing ATPase